MHSHRSIWSFVIAALCVTVVSPIRAEPSPTLQAPLRALLKGKLAARAQIAFLAVDLADGRTLTAHTPKRRLNPASVSKLFTTLTALDHFGPSHRYVTLVATDSLRNGIAQNLYLRGEGDPGLSELDLIAIALQLKRAGVSKVRGRIVVDRRAFDRRTLPPAFEQKKTEDWYRPTIDALATNQGYVTIVVDGRERPVGAKPRVTLIPNCDYLRLDNRATLRATKKGEALVISARADGTRTLVTISGSLRVGRTAARRKRIYHASRFAASLFRRQLRRVGIQAPSGLDFGALPAKARVLVRWKSAPLEALVARTNKTSSNFMAEMLLKSLATSKDGEPASFAAALEMVRRYLRERVKLSPGFTLKNGSGLYDANRFSPSQIVALLRYASRDPYLFPYFRNSLSVAGTDGTLRLRFRGETTKRKIFAKTGTLDGVSAIAGYLRSRRGRRVAFAVLINGPVVPYRKYRELHDRIVKLIAEQN